MPYNFQKLTQDVTAALQAGEEAAALSDDKGACNFDGVILHLPRINEQKVIKALSDAGVDSDKAVWPFCGVGYMINPTTNGQGNKRMVATTAMLNYLREAGHNVIDYRAMD